MVKIITDSTCDLTKERMEGAWRHLCAFDGAHR